MTSAAHPFTVVARGLRFPEGPVAMADGSVVLTEMFGGRLTRVHPDGTTEKVADIEGGANGLAVGPDGAFYLCNNGNAFTPVENGELLYPGPFDPDRYIGGRIQRVDPVTGEVRDLYTRGGDVDLRAPNDLVFDAAGGFWFTDHGIRHGRVSDRTGIWYATIDGGRIEEMIFPVDSPNGIGLSPDGSRLYWAETSTGRVWERDLAAPGVPDPASGPRVLCGLPGHQLLDSLAVDGDGNVCVATLVNGCVTVVSPSGDIVAQHPTGDRITTNICFGGPDHGTAYVAASSTGTLLAMRWPGKGLRLHWQ